MGYVHVYTGNGKGKTSAAVGAAIRAAGAGRKIYIMQFMKGRAYSEQNILRKLPEIDLYTTGKPFFVAKAGTLTEEFLKELGDDVVVFEPGQPPAEYMALIAAGVDKAVWAAKSGKYDMVILDEVNVAVFFELLPLDAVCRLIDELNPKTELILTGRGAPAEIIERADLVTEMKEVKHYYAKGVEARLGIEC